jgi:hypothetical protein
MRAPSCWMEVPGETGTAGMEPARRFREARPRTQEPARPFSRQAR